MAAATGRRQTAVSRIWRAFGLKPHLVQTWKLSTDPEFVSKSAMSSGSISILRRKRWSWRWMRRAQQIEPLDRTAPCLPVLPTTPARMTHDYVRHGTARLFATVVTSSRAITVQTVSADLALSA
jgi:hypothetical protein